MDTQLKTRGKQARQRAMDLAGSSRIPAECWFPSIQWLEDLGYTRKQIAEAINLNERRIREIMRWGNEEGSALVHIEKAAVQPDALEAKFQAMLEFSVDGFRRFYEYFDDRPLPAHCAQWVQYFIDNRNLMLNVPPRHMKSSIFSKWVPVWLLCMDRNELILIVSKTGTLARIWAADIANTLEFGDVPQIFGRFAPQRKGETPWRPGQGEMLVLGATKKRRGTQYSIFARGSGQQVLGHEATVVICDDPTDAAIAKSETQNTEQMEWFREQVLSRIENQSTGTNAAGRAVIVGQRVHPDDLYGQIIEQVYERGPKLGQQLWKVITEPAVIEWPKLEDESDAVVLWPEKWNFEELMLQYERVGGEKPFMTMFQQDPRPDAYKLVRPEWWEACRQYGRNGGEGVLEASGNNFLPFSRVVSLDPSPKNYNGLVVADIMYDRSRFVATIISVERFKGSMRDIILAVDRAIETYNPDYLVIEYSTYVHWLEEDPLFQKWKVKTKVMPHQTGANKGDPDLGIESLGGDVEAGCILLPYGDADGQAMSRILEEEMNVWPTSRHPDDCTMALWFMKWNYRRFMPRDAYSGFQQQGIVKTPTHLIGGFRWTKKGK